ncbi:hypothetical protein OROHE_017010 [Orobanche hederae]
MKIKLRKSLLLVTVFVPIVLHNDTLGAYFTSSSSRYEFVEEVSTFAFAGEESSSTTLKEPLAIVCSKKSLKSNLENSNAPSGDNTRITRQFTRGCLDGNPNRLVIDEAHEKTTLETGEDKNSNGAELSGVVQNDVKKGFSLRHPKGTTWKPVQQEGELKNTQHSSWTSIKDTSREQVKARNEKQKEQTPPPDARIKTNSFEERFIFPSQPLKTILAL